MDQRIDHEIGELLCALLAHVEVHTSIMHTVDLGVEASRVKFLLIYPLRYGLFLLLQFLCLIIANFHKGVDTLENRRSFKFSVRLSDALRDRKSTRLNSSHVK